jgi:hypothetical protein
LAVIDKDAVSYKQLSCLDRIFNFEECDMPSKDVHEGMVGSRNQINDAAGILAQGIELIIEARDLLIANTSLSTDDPDLQQVIRE